jgi:hypothetical protein
MAPCWSSSTAAQDLGLHVRPSDHLLHPSSYVFEKRSPERLFIPAIEKENCRKIWWGVSTLDRMLAFAPLPRSAHTRFMLQLMRSMTDRATPVREDRNVENAARAPSDPALPKDDARRVTIDNIYKREALTRLAFGNPATVTTTTVRGAPSSGSILAPCHFGTFRSACASKLPFSACCIAIFVGPSGIMGLRLGIAELSRIISSWVRSRLPGPSTHQRGWGSRGTPHGSRAPWLYST